MGADKGIREGIPADHDRQGIDIYIDTSRKGPSRGEGTYIYKVAMDIRGKTYDVGGQKTLSMVSENEAVTIALREALSRLTRTGLHITIWTECHYVAAVLENKWYDQWAANGWNNSRGQPVCDVAYWREIKEMLDRQEYEVKCKEHHPFSEWMRWTLMMTGKEQ